MHGTKPGSSRPMRIAVLADGAVCAVDRRTRRSSARLRAQDTALIPRVPALMPIRQTGNRDDREFPSCAPQASSRAYGEQGVSGSPDGVGNQKPACPPPAMTRGDTRLAAVR